MIRSFKDKLKKKQEVYQAKQQVLAEQAEQARIQKENEWWEEEILAEQARVNAILQKESYRKEQEYLKEKARQNAITRRRIEEWESAEEDRLAKFELSKKIIAEGHIRESERYIAKSKQKSKSKIKCRQNQIKVSKDSQKNIKLSRKR